MKSPVGELTLFAEDGALVAVEWGRGSGSAPTPLLIEARDQLNAYFGGHLKTFDLPLRPPGTAFQRSVWGLMSDIPFGRVRTYGGLARDLGSSPRAVGGACRRNPIPLVIPCHRIVGAGRRLAGFSGGDGTDTKRALLDIEGVKDIQP